MKVHFVGIGGIGVSALAKYYLEKGHEVSGSDLVSSEITDYLKKLGAKIYIGKHKISNLKTQKSKPQLKIQNLPHLVIYSPAVQMDNPELKEARKLGIKCLSYPEALGELTKKYFTIAVSGTHGKSTTAAMISLLLEKAGLDPTVIIGTKLKEFGNPALSDAEGSNCRVGKPIRRAQGKVQYLVIEADEWQASFLNYWPRIIVLTNIEREHLDYYKNLNHILKTYREYIGHLSEDGVLVVNEDDKNSAKLKAQNLKPQLKTQNYTIKQKEAKILKRILKILGEHNIYNALAALTVARALKIPDKTSFKALSEYKGAWRRFEIKHVTYNMKHITVISDYGHHPTEIKTTLEAAREKFPKQKIWCVFQPHQYQRTFYLFNDFVKVFSKSPIDNLIITDIYDVAGREKKRIKKIVSSKRLIKKISRPWAIYLPKEKIINYLKNNLKNGDILIIMGAGDIYLLVNEFSTSD